MPPTDHGARPSRWPHLPDGRVQVGIGPGAWILSGWPEDEPRGDLARFLEELGSPPARHAALTGAEVVGEGPLADRIRSALAVPVDPGSDPRPRPSPHRVGSVEGDPVVLVRDYLVPVGTARRPDLVGRAVLPVVAQTARIVVGPWTATSIEGSPCLHCLDLHRRDRSAQWPTVAAALDDPLTALHPPRHDSPVVDIACALAVLLSRHPDARPTGLAHEVGPAPPHVVTRRWERHPACPWHSSRSDAA